jgi:hypothetical protein
MRFALGGSAASKHFAPEKPLRPQASKVGEPRRTQNANP